MDVSGSWAAMVSGQQWLGLLTCCLSPERV